MGGFKRLVCPTCNQLARNGRSRGKYRMIICDNRHVHCAVGSIFVHPIALSIHQPLTLPDRRRSENRKPRAKVCLADAQPMVIPTSNWVPRAVIVDPEFRVMNEVEALLAPVPKPKRKYVGLEPVIKAEIPEFRVPNLKPGPPVLSDPILKSEPEPAAMTVKAHSVDEITPGVRRYTMKG